MARRLPPLNALRAFEASARLGSFVAAAAELRVSPAAVSQQVRLLETYLDTTLFLRLARGVALTDQGRDYLPELSAGFDLLSESTARVRAKRADGVLTITTLAAFATGWLLPRLHRFRERAPRVDVVLRTSRQLMDFRRDAIDLAIRFGPAPARGLHGELLCHEELFPVASPTLFNGGRVPDTLTALSRYPLLHDTDAATEHPWQGWRAWFERAGLPTTAVARGPQFSESIVLIGAAVAGLGIAIGRAPLVAPLLARGQLVRVTQETWTAPWNYFLTAPAAHFRRPVVRTFVDWALEEVRTTAGIDQTPGIAQ
jgi:LysR family transcriptional regulator, glycine cleavage system transcriptional activator